jgi:hypothetical protein
VNRHFEIVTNSQESHPHRQEIRRFSESCDSGCHHAEASRRRVGRHDLAKKQTEAVLGDLVTHTTKHLRKGDKIRCPAWAFSRVEAGGEAIKIKASKKIAFSRRRN